MPSFFDAPILNSPYEYPSRHWELDSEGQPTDRILDERRKVSFITPIPRPKKRKGGGKQEELVFDEGQRLSSTRPRNDVDDNWRRLVPTLAGESGDGAAASALAVSRLREHAAVLLQVMTSLNECDELRLNVRVHLWVSGVRPGNEFLGGSGCATGNRMSNERTRAA